MITSRRSSKRYLVALFGSLILAGTSGGSDPAPSYVDVSLSTQKPLTLAITIRSRSEDRVTLAKWRLPWGNKSSILLVPVNDEGVCIDNKYYVEEYPNYEKVSIDPKGSISGEIDLQRSIPELSESLKKSDVHLFWAYRAPSELQIGEWSGGWILIRKEK